MITSVQNSPTAVDAAPQQSRWWSFKEGVWKKICDTLRFSSVKNWLTQMAAYAKQLWSLKRMRYMPMTSLFLLLLSASQADAQCCGAQANFQAWLKVWNTTNYTDFFSANNWRTKDGLTREWYFNFHQSVFMTEFVLWYGRLWQIQDDANHYTGDFSHVAASVMFAWSSDRSFIPYVGIRGWYMHSQVEWVNWWNPYEYTWGRFFWWPVAWANVNIGEAVAVWIRAQSTYFFTDTDNLEWISAWKNPDSQGKWIYPGAYGLRIGYIFQ